MHAWPNDTLVTAARDGDVDAIAAIVAGSHPHVARFARSLCASPEDAEDAAQEALIVLYRRIGTLRATGALAGWLFRVVQHECVRRARLAVRAAPPTGARDEAPSAEQDALARVEAQRIAAAIAALPEEQRVVLLLRDVQGVPGPEVARALGLGTAAMKSRLHRARSAVRAALQSSD